MRGGGEGPASSGGLILMPASDASELEEWRGVNLPDLIL